MAKWNKQPKSGKAKKAWDKCQAAMNCKLRTLTKTTFLGINQWNATGQDPKIDKVILNFKFEILEAPPRTKHVDRFNDLFFS